MAELEQVLRTVVNTWECDEMGHLNVRYYPARETEAVRVLIARCGLPPALLRDRGLRLRFREKHVRFHREMRPGTGFDGHAGFVAARPEQLDTYCELRSLDGTVRGTVLGSVGLCEASSGEPREFPTDVIEAARQRLVEVPTHGQARGVSRDTPRAAPELEEATRLQMAPEYLGSVDPVHVDAWGYAEPAGFYARVSDGIQHFFRTFSEGRRPGIGGAVLEFRMVSRADCRRDDLLEIRSGLRAVGPKTRHFCHWVFEPISGRCVATAEAVAVAFDLQARKAVAFEDEELARMQAHVIDGASI